MPYTQSLPLLLAIVIKEWQYYNKSKKQKDMRYVTFVKIEVIFSRDILCFLFSYKFSIL
jgi:hypothetical protein